jgi:hypothetical protein
MVIGIDTPGKVFVVVFQGDQPLLTDFQTPQPLLSQQAAQTKEIRTLLMVGKLILQE